MTANFKATQNCIEMATKAIGNPSRSASALRSIVALIKKSEAQLSTPASISGLTASDREKMRQDIDLLTSFLADQT